MVSLVILIWIKSIEAPELICIGKKDGSIECKNYHENVDVPKRHKNHRIITPKPNPTPAPEPTPAPGHPVYNFGNVRITNNTKQYAKTFTCVSSNTVVENFPPVLTFSSFSNPTSDKGGALYFSFLYPTSPDFVYSYDYGIYNSRYYIDITYNYLGMDRGKTITKSITSSYLIEQTFETDKGPFSFSEITAFNSTPAAQKTQGGYIFPIPTSEPGITLTDEVTLLHSEIKFSYFKPSDSILYNDAAIVHVDTLFNLTYPAFSSQLDGSIASYKAIPIYS